jgi:hypothetical protein
MQVLSTIVLATACCTHTFAETIRMSQDGIDVEVTLSPTTITVGDPLALTVQAITDAETVLTFENDGAFDSFTVVESHDLLDIPSEAGRHWTWSMQLDTFDASVETLSGIELQWANELGRTGVITVAPIPVSVTSVAGDALKDMALRDIKPSVPLYAKKWVRTILLGSACFAILGWIAIFVVRRRRKPVLCPYEQAMLAIRVLKGQTLDVQPFYTSLSDIVRQYLEGQFKISATGQTTREFLNAAKQNPHLEHSDRESLGSFLVAADLVKFARHEPRSNVNEDAIHLAEVFIKDTQEVAA